MNRFLTTSSEYKRRLGICKTCEHYFIPTGSCKKCGCFMRVKAKISAMSCADNPKRWLKTSALEDPEIIPQELIEEVREIWPDIENKRAKDHETKKKLITLYNTLYNTGYSATTSCSSCLSQIYDGVHIIYKKYIKDE